MTISPVESVAEGYIDLLAARGIDYFFGNGGTDFAPLVDAYAKRIANELPMPKPVLVPHETTAVAMAHGYTMVTRKPQVVMVHTIAGTANASGMLINASRQMVPMLFSAGRTPITEKGVTGTRDLGIHWAQESRDQGSMVREWVKWDYELRPDVELESIVDRALAISETEPQGPVYLTLPREVLAEEIESIAYADQPRMQPAQAMPLPETIRDAARALARASNPIAIAKASGRDPAAVAPLVRLAELLNMPVFEAMPTHVNFPGDHRLHAGGIPGPHLAGADVVLVLESDVPWMPSSGLEPAESATIIGIGQDPLFSDYANRGFRVDINLAGSPRAALTAIADALTPMEFGEDLGEDLGESLDPAEIEQRGDRWSAHHDTTRSAALERAEAGRTQRPLNKAWVSRAFDQFRDDDMIILSEIGFDASQFELTRPGSYFALSSAGVLGWGIGAALGAKLAAPNKTVVACVGDGSYIFGAPEAGHWVSRKMNLPVLWVVWNNAQWGAVAGAARGVYPDGWAAQTNNFPFSDLSPSLDYEYICQSAGGYGEKVEDPADVPAAFERALNVVRNEGRQALLNIVAAPR
jgi:acetolactate synthase I/II/III large subunit